MIRGFEVLSEDRWQSPLAAHISTPVALLVGPLTVALCAWYAKHVRDATSPGRKR